MIVRPEAVCTLVSISLPQLHRRINRGQFPSPDQNPSYHSPGGWSLDRLHQHDPDLADRAVVLLSSPALAERKVAH